MTLPLPPQVYAQHHWERWMCGGSLDNQEMNQIMVIVRDYSFEKLIVPINYINDEVR